MTNDILSRGLKIWNIDISEQQIENFETLTAAMLDYNQKVNLTRITEPDDIIKLHYLDSLSLLGVLDIPLNSKVIDVGTGAGFPGLPLKIIRTDLDMVLLDSLNKRVEYLKSVSEKLKLDKIKPLHGRAEELSLDIKHRERYDIAVSRAVASLPMLCELCLAFVRPGGYFISYKGKDAKEELDMAENAISKMGASLYKIAPVEIYQSDISRSLIIIKKVQNTSKEFPRKNALIQKKPL